MQHWDYYWQKTKTLNSFAEGEHGLGYTGEIAEFWRSVFAEVNNNSQVLDLATGNGGLAVLALECNQSFQISASDKAKIAPLQLFTDQDENYSRLQRIKFYGGMPSEKLIFADEKFDIVISQFGFEYSNPEKTLQEIYRILKPEGKLTALIHSAESFISRDCKLGLTVLPVFIDKDGLLDKTKIFAGCCQQLAIFDVLSIEQQQLLKFHSDQLLASFVATQQSLTQEQLDWFNLIAKDLMPLLGNWRSLSVEAIDNVVLNLSQFSKRLADQLAASWSESKASDIKELATNNGFVASLSNVKVNDGTLCWVLNLKKQQGVKL